jgi:hypothetical protein
VILERPLTLEEATPIIPRIDESAQSRESFSAGGYGLTSDREDAPSGQRMRIDGNEALCAPDECYLDYPEIVTDAEWVSADAGVCSGDSGGPALDAEGRVIGVASRGGEECRATVYGDVATWSDFLIETAAHAADVGGYPAPIWTSGSSEAPADWPEQIQALPAADPVILDEPEEGQRADDDPPPGDPADPECDPSECSQSQTLAAESGCALRAPTRWNWTGLVLMLTFCAGLARRRARG